MRRFEVDEKETYFWSIWNPERGVNCAVGKAFKTKVPVAGFHVLVKVDIVKGRGSRKRTSDPVWNPEVIEMVIPSMMVEASAGAKTSEVEKG